MRSNLTKKDIINSIYMQIGFSKKISEHILEDILQLILDSIIAKKKARIGRNPKTKETVLISERNVILFKASKDLKLYINNNDQYKRK